MADIKTRDAVKYLDSHERKLLIHSLVCGDKGKSGTGILR